MAGGGFTQPFGGGLITRMPDSTNAGTISSGRLRMATDPTDGDTVTIGGHVFKFLTTLVAADTFTQVLRGGGASDTRLLFLDAINGVTNVDVVPATTPHTLAIVADVVDTSRIRVRQATHKGGTAVAKAPASIAVSESLTAAADIWDVANLNETGSAPGRKWAQSRLVVTAAMITAGQCFLEFPFTPTCYIVMLHTSSGGVRYCNEAITISGNAIKIELLGGASPNTQANDILEVMASE